MEPNSFPGADGRPDAARQTDRPASRDAGLAAALARVERLAGAIDGVDRAMVVLAEPPPGWQPAPDGGAEAALLAAAPLIDRAGGMAGELRLLASARRAPLAPGEAAQLDDLAALAADALELARAARALARDTDGLTLRERLLGIVAEAPSFTVAIEASMAALRDATQAKLCLFFRLGPDGEHLHLVAGQASTPALTEAFVAHLRGTQVRRDNSLVGLVASAGQQRVVTAIDDAALRRFPAISLSISQGIAAQVVTPISLGAERYAFSVGFGTVLAELDAVAATLMGLATTLRPLLRRLRDAEEIELFRRAVDASDDAVIISEADGPGGPRIRYVNDAFTRQTGYHREAVLGRPHTLLRATAMEAEAAACLAAGTPLRRDVLSRRADGSQFWADSSMAPFAGVSGARTHWVAIERDITRRKEAEEAIALNEERFRLVARAVTDVVWDWDLTTGGLWWNEGMQTQFGYPPDQVQPTLQWWTERIAETERRRVVQGLRGAVAGTLADWREEYRFRKADGCMALVSDRGFVLRGPDGRPMRMVGCMVDITRQRQLEEQLSQSQRLDALGKLTGGVAHDFNNLLAVIIGNAEMLSETGRDEPGLREPAGLIIGAAERGADLARRLLTFARLQPLEPRPTDVSHLLGEVEAMVRRLIGSNIEIVCAPVAAAAHVVIDRPQLENALLNLCINARDAMPGGGRLRISSAILPAAAEMRPPGAPAGECVTITVEDTGTGMSPEVLSRAFEPFFTTKPFGQGSGLGLSMVFGFMEQSRGHVAIQSQPGQGTSVTLYLPRAAAAPPVEAPAPARPAGAGAVILLVEDDAALRGVVAAQLGWLGYQVVSAADGREALEIIQAHEGVDLLFTDIVMPGGMSGQQLAMRAQRLRPHLPVLFTSGYPGSPLPDNNRMKLLAKPYRIADLAQRINQALGNHAPAPG